MVEVGVLLGRLSEAILQARPDVSVIMVDNWLPTDKQPEAYRATGDDHALASANRAAAHRREAYHRAGQFPGRATIVECSSVEAAAADWQPFDLVFLDADHSEEGVAADIAAWRTHVKPGGWIGGHDYRNDDPRFDFSGVERAVRAVFDAPEADANFTWWVRL